MAKKRGRPRAKKVTSNSKFHTLHGIDEVMEELNRVLKHYKATLTNKGFIEVAIEIRRSTEANSPLTPLDTGNLRASWFTVIKGKGEQDTGTFPLTKPEKVKKSELAFQRSVVAAMNVASNSINHPNMIFGYSANYAAAVHEMEGGDIKWNRAGSGPKWLERHLKIKKFEILKIMANNLRKL